MDTNKKLPDNQITVYQTSDGKINIEVLYANENIWLPQKRIAELFDVDRSVVTKHLKNIFSENELQEDSVCANYAHTAEDGKEYQTNFYSLEAIIAVGYRVNSERGTQFRQWAISILQQYIHKGFVIDSDRFKYGSRFSTRYFGDLLEEISTGHKAVLCDGAEQTALCHYRADSCGNYCQTSQQRQAKYGIDIMAKSTKRQNHAG